jgi:hypothetical protein
MGCLGRKGVSLRTVKLMETVCDRRLAGKPIAILRFGGRQFRTACLIPRGEAEVRVRVGGIKFNGFFARGKRF